MLPIDMLPVYKKDDFLFFKGKKNDENDEKLIIDVSKIDLISNYMQKNNLKNVMINSSYFPFNDLTFLKYLPFIQSVSVVDNNLDVSLINELKELNEIRLGSFKGILDCNNFPQLEKLGVEWNNKLKNLTNATNLKWLWLDNYKCASLEEFKDLKKLTYLYLYKSSITSLKGIEHIYSLNDLNIDTASKLESLEGLNVELNHLENVYIYSAKQLKNYEPISKLAMLKHLELRKTGETNSIDFIKGLTNLEKVVLGFKVLDGNMSYLKGIKDVGFIDFPHYSQKMKDFN